MHKIFYMLLVAFGAITANAQATVTLRNTTGDRLISVIVNGKSIGSIENNAVHTIEFNASEAKNGLSKVVVSAIRRGEKLQASTHSMVCRSGGHIPVTEKHYAKSILLSVDNVTGRNTLQLE